MLPNVSLETSPPIDISDHLGPVSYLAVEFPTGIVSGDGFTRLLDLADAGLVLVLDLEFVRRTADGSLTTVAADTVEVSGGDLSAFVGADSGLLDRDDLELVGRDLAQGGLLAVLVFENLALEPVLAAWAAGGGRLVAEGPVDVADLEVAAGADIPASP